MPTKVPQLEIRDADPPADPPRALVLAAILAAAALMMAVTGYSFMAGNHEVYLLEPLRRAGLASFEGDWFVTGTLQYHGLFAEIAAVLLRLDVARPAFLVLFLILLLTTAGAWWRIVRALGGDVTAYLVAVVLYHVLLGDRALGFYSLLQDGQFNAGNVAAVALLVGIAMWIEGRPICAGLAFGVAGAFHLNYAVVAPGLWLALLMWTRLGGPASPRAVGADNARTGGRRDLKPPSAALLRNAADGAARVAADDTSRDLLRRPAGTRALPLVIATVLAVLPSFVNVALALPAKLTAREAMPLDQFVDLYVRLRHPHHYDPLGWPWWVWAAFLAPIPLAVLAYRRVRSSLSLRERVAAERPGEGVARLMPIDRLPSPGSRTRHPLPGGEGVAGAWRAAARVWLILMALQAFALLTAGVFWAGETFVQLSLWRFSPHAKLLAVSGVAVWVLRSRGLFLALVLLWAPMLTDIFLWLFDLMPSSYVGRHVIASLALSVVGSSALGSLKGISGRHRRLLEIAAGISAFGLAALLGGVGKLPLPLQDRTDRQVIDGADWAGHSTNGEAVFLLPPDASAFSVLARRGQVVSFKLVPQLSGELIEWDQRLRDVLDVPDLSVYAGGVTGYRRSQEAMRRRYDELPVEHLAALARRYGARYVYRSAEDPTPPAGASVAWRGAGGAILYDLGSAPATRPTSEPREGDADAPHDRSAAAGD